LRLLLKLRISGNSRLTLNYNYSLSAAIYGLLRFGSAEFSSFLHDIGFESQNKTYKLFTFALRLRGYTIDEGSFNLINPNAYLYISTPLVDTFIQNFIIGTFEKQKMEINGSKGASIFTIEQVESLPEPQFKEQMKFKLLSPLVLSTKRQIIDELKQYYLRPGDTDKINEVLTNNLKNKYRIINKGETGEAEVKLKWDEFYLRKHDRVTKKITINENGKYPVEIIGINAPFTIEGNPELIKVGYECGFGEKNSMGFGLVDTNFTN